MIGRSMWPMANHTHKKSGGSSSGRRRKQRKIEVIWEYDPAPDAEERLSQAFRMLFRDIGKSQQKEKKQGQLF